LFLKLVINDNKQNRFCLDNAKITLIFENQIFNLNFYLPSVLHPPLSLAVAPYFVCAIKKLLKPKIEFRCSPRKNNSYMAHLEVKPKSGAPWWLWLLLALIALAIILFFINRNNSSIVLNLRPRTSRTKIFAYAPVMAIPFTRLAKIYYLPLTKAPYKAIPKRNLNKFRQL